MLKNENIICISTIDWDFIWQGHQEIMGTLAREGNKVLYIENTGVRPPGLQDIPRLRKRIVNWFKSVKGIRKESDNLFIYSPLILPFPYSRIARFMNSRLMISAIRRLVRSAGLHNPIIWVFLPTGITLDIIDALNHKLVVYYCIDNFSASSGPARKIAATEVELIKRSDLVFATARNLYDRCARFNKNVHLFPFGVNTGIYEKARSRKIVPPADIASISKPIAGYVGGVHKWVDFGLVKELAVSRPELSFVFVGPLQRGTDELKRLPNVHFLGQKRYEELPDYIDSFDLCMIPYLVTDYTKNVYPTKINEYLSMGKPVVSTAIPEVAAFNERNGGIIEVAGSPGEYLAAIDRTLSARSDSTLPEKRIAVAAREGSWMTKISQMCDLIEAGIRRRREALLMDWKDNFLKLYKETRRRFLPAFGVICILYIGIFYTPIAWYAAGPLRADSRADKSDVIAVFAGGVGESGKAAQGYEERVQKAVELYRKGYGRHMIFSSGYVYFFKEPYVMKALAVSLGVPESDIIIEDAAKNTADNVLCTSRIMREHGWKSAVVVTAPYHTRRVSMVAAKLAPDIDFSYAPMDDSVFFAHSKYDSDGRRIWRRITFSQLKAIIHEYAAIVFYRIRGYA